MDGTEKSLFKIVGTTMKHFASYVYLKALQAGESIRLRVYNKVDDVSHWKFDNDVTDSVSTNNGTITNVSSWISQWKFDGNVLDSVGINNGTITYHANLKSLYKFENNVNATVGNNGTVTGTTTFVPGKEEQAFSFDGSSYILASDTGLSAVNTAWSVSGWINPTSFAAQRSIYAWGSNVANQGINIYTNTSGKIVIDNVTGALLTSTGTIQTGIATFITVTYDGTTLRLYINGIQDSTATPAALNITLAGASGQHIGTYISNTSNFLGWIDELRNYNITLSQAQVSALYMNGKFGQSHTFDNGEYISVGNPTNLQFTNTSAFSISAWVKTTGTTEQGIVVKGGGGTTGYDIHILSNGVFVFRLWDTADHSILSGSGFNDGNWHNVVAVYTGSGNQTGMSLYVDGVLSAIGTASIINSITTTVNVLIGNYNSTIQPLTGQIDEVRIFNTALSSSQVSGLYNYTGSNYVTPLPVGNALSLDGSSYVTVTNQTSYNFNNINPFSISCWAKSNASGEMAIVGKGGGGAIGYDIHWLNGQIIFRLWDGIDHSIATPLTYNDGNWHNITATYTGNSNATGMKLYIDGVLIITGTASAIGAITNSTNVIIGAYSSFGNKMSGLLDEVQIWNYVLSSAEINAINAGRFANTHPIGYWKFDGDLTDSSGQGSTGSPTGTMTFVTGALSGSYNVPNVHFNFEGSEYINAGSLSNLNFERTQPLTITGWIRTTNTASQQIVSKFLSVSTGWYGGISAAGVLQFQEANTNNVNDFTCNSGTSINDGLWHFITIAYDGSSNPANVKFYVDGVLGTTTVGRNNLTGSILNTASVVIGALDTSFNNPFIGEIDDLRVYNRVLSSAEVSDLFTYPDSEMKSLVYDKTYTGIVPDAKFEPFLPENQYMITAQQLSGNNRIISWQRTEVS